MGKIGKLIENDNTPQQRQPFYTIQNVDGGTGANVLTRAKTATTK